MLIEAALVTIVLLVGALLVALGAAGAVLAFRTVRADVAEWRESRRSRLWQAAEGRIQSAVVTLGRHGRRRSWGTRVVYSYHAGGQARSSHRVRFGATLGELSQPADVQAEVARYAPGTAVTVFFDPDDPDRATLERNRPGLAWGFAIAALLLCVAAGIGSAGVYVLLGPIQDPPDFPPEELPPLTAQLGGLALGVGVVLALVAACAARRARTLLPLQRLVDAAREFRGEAEGGRAVAVSGRAEPSDGTLVAPPRGEAALVFHVRAMDADRVALEAEGRKDFFVAWEHGRVRVRVEGARNELSPARSWDDDDARAWVDAAYADGVVPAPVAFSVETRLLAPGDPVLVIGRLRIGRDGNPLLCAVHGDDTSLVLAAGPLVELRGRLEAPRRRARACAWGCAAAIASGTMLLLL